MQHPAKLYRLRAAEPERFAAVAFLSERLHQLRGARPVATMAARLTTHDFAWACVIVRYDDEPGGVLGYVVIGEPEYEAERQDRLLTQSLEGTAPGRERRYA